MYLMHDWDNSQKHVYIPKLPVWEKLQVNSFWISPEVAKLFD